MPTYDYQCQKCGHKFEKFQSMSASTLRKCPQCGKLSLVRLIGSGAGVIFKGSGFYETDYRSESYKSAAKKDAPVTTPTPASTPAGSEKPAKSETKTETKSETPKPVKQSFKKQP